MADFEAITNGKGTSDASMAAMPNFSPERNEEFKQSADWLNKGNNNDSSKSSTYDPLTNYRTVDSKDSLRNVIDGRLAQNGASDILPDFSLSKTLEEDLNPGARPYERPEILRDLPMNPTDGDSDHINDLLKGLAEKAKKITPEDRKEAKEALGEKVSPLINEADKKTLKSMQDAIVDGDVGKLAETLKNMPPERVKEFVKELNKQLKENGAGVQMSVTGDGRAFLYETSGETAIQFNRDGTTQVKPIRHKSDGSVVIEPGETINKDAGDVMKGISDRAVRRITRGDRFERTFPEYKVPAWPGEPNDPFWPKEPKEPLWPRQPQDPIDRPRFKPLPYRPKFEVSPADMWEKKQF